GPPGPNRPSTPQPDVRPDVRPAAPAGRPRRRRVRGGGADVRRVPGRLAGGAHVRRPRRAVRGEMVGVGRRAADGGGRHRAAR
ncbi:MAG: hypothetical protein AVDCRST_MAG64-4001, partial [uncultured Phycisphaerae bacterium]